MTAFEIIMVMIGIIILLITFGMFLLALLTYIECRHKQKK